MAEVPPINISLILGPVVVATLVNALLTGICMVQFLEYYDSRIKDGPSIIGLVIWVAIVDTFSSCTSSYVLWHYAVDNFENKIGLFSAPWQSTTIPITTTLISVPVQFFLARRIHIFSKSLVLFVIICALSLAQGGLAFASSIGALLDPYVEEYAKLIPVTDSWLAIAVACDASITMVLSYYLWKSRAGMKASDKALISKLIRTSVETALPVTVFCISGLVFLVNHHAQVKPVLDILIAPIPIVHKYPPDDSQQSFHHSSTNGAPALDYPDHWRTEFGESHTSIIRGLLGLIARPRLIMITPNGTTLSGSLSDSPTP
ncbi:hypothetical protein D9758_004127 [Tetrapyrgos nigripes]|uniref:DUF6534 domain-containing protein n=1 Tax=Tetrapyrgos nigripes TaxID=182062 RepID=A0A8H5LVT3_9AGAR|nr:hypothetical protein D9758_004127 [Tetrapyrgos nigripes]